MIVAANGGVLSLGFASEIIQVNLQRAQLPGMLRDECTPRPPHRRCASRNAPTLHRSINHLRRSIHSAMDRIRKPPPLPPPYSASDAGTALSVVGASRNFPELGLLLVFVKLWLPSDRRRLQRWLYDYSWTGYWMLSGTFRPLIASSLGRRSKVLQFRWLWIRQFVIVKLTPPIGLARCPTGRRMVSCFHNDVINIFRMALSCRVTDVTKMSFVIIFRGIIMGKRGTLAPQAAKDSDQQPKKKKEIH